MCISAVFARVTTLSRGTFHPRDWPHYRSCNMEVNITSVIHLPLMTPSGFSMGTTLNTNFLRSSCAHRSLLSKNSRTPVCMYAWMFQHQRLACRVVATGC